MFTLKTSLWSAMVCPMLKIDYCSYRKQIFKLWLGMLFALKQRRVV